MADTASLNKKISELDAIPEIADGDLIAIVDLTDSTTKKGTELQIKDYISPTPLPIARGGTNSTTALNNGRLIYSSPDAKIVESAIECNGPDIDINAGKITFGVGTDTTHNALEYNNLSATKPVVKWSSTIGGLTNVHGLHLEIQESAKHVGHHIESHGASVFHILSTRNPNFSLNDQIGYMSTGQPQSGTRKYWSRHFDAPSANLKIQSINDAVVTDRFIMNFTSGLLSVGTSAYEALVLADNDIPNKKYVDDAVEIENLLDRVTGTPNYLKPHNLGDHFHLNDEESSLFTTSEFQMFKNVAADITLWTASAARSTDSDLDLVRSRGTIASPLAVQDGDLIGNINFIGYDGGTFRNGAEIRAVINGSVSGSNLPCDLAFYVNAGGGVATEGMRLVKDKKLAIDFIHEFTGSAGVTIESLLHLGEAIQGANVTITAAGGTLKLDSQVDLILQADSSYTINPDKADADITIKSPTSDNFMFFDMSTNRIGVLTATPSVAWEVAGSTKISAGTFALATGTTINEISTIVNASSTDNQAVTGEAVYEVSVLGMKVAVPLTPTSSGTTGQWAYGSNYEYRCVATNTWTRKLVITSW